MNEINGKMRHLLKKTTILMLSMAFVSSALNTSAKSIPGPGDDDSKEIYENIVNMAEIGMPSPAPVKAEVDKLNLGSNMVSPRIVLEESYEMMAEPVAVSNVAMPASFRGVKANRITGQENLRPLFKEIAKGNRTIRILQIGDSHVRGNIFPQTIAKVLEGNLNQDGKNRVKVDFIGINGARASKFTSEELLRQIAAKRPDLVIISFGGNEAHGNFNYDNNTQVLHRLVEGIRRHIPNAQFLLTTPPGSFATKGGVKVPLTTYESVSNNILNFGMNNGIAVWDHFHNIGGTQNAANNWWNAKLMQNDRIHLTVSGYKLMGSLLAEAILNAYNSEIRR